MPLLPFLLALLPSAHAQVLETTTGPTTPEVAQGQAVNLKQPFETGASTTAVIRWPDGTRLKLKPGTAIESAGSDDVTLKKGAVFTEVPPAPEQKNAPAKKPRFLLRTEAAILGVRGTLFFTAVTPSGAHAGAVWMCVKEGTVSVEPKAAQAPKREVPAGMGVFVDPKKGATAPEALAWTKNLNWSMKGDVTDTTKLESSYYDLLNQDYD